MLHLHPARAGHICSDSYRKRPGVHAFHITDSLNALFTVFYRNKLLQNDPFVVTKHCHHLCTFFLFDVKRAGICLHTW